MMGLRTDDPRKLSLWTRAMALSAVVVMGLLVVMLAEGAAAVHRTPLTAGPERINPNTASLASLVRLAGIGTARALDIIHYRQSHAGDELVFQVLTDMEKIKGIGPKTAQAMAPYLTFETESKTE